MHVLTETMEKLESVKSLKEKMLECLKSEVSTKGFTDMSVEETGEVVDMIKDLAETEKCCMEALYYQKVTEAMVSYDEPRYGESAAMGYNRNRYPSSGRFAPSGSGSRMGFMRPHVPYLEYGGDMQPNDYMNEAMYGYSDGRGMQSMNSNRGDRMGYREGDMDPRYGKAYNEYRTRRRHFTETKSPEDRKEMDVHAEEHVRDTIATIRDIWSDADPTLKKRMREDFSKLLNEMGTA